MAAVISRPGNCKRESSGRLMREFGDSFHATRSRETGRVADSRTGPSASQFQGAGDDGRHVGAAAARLSRGDGNIGAGTGNHALNVDKLLLVKFQPASHGAVECAQQIPYH